VTCLNNLMGHVIKVHVVKF